MKANPFLMAVLGGPWLLCSCLHDATGIPKPDTPSFFPDSLGNTWVYETRAYFQGTAGWSCARVDRSSSWFPRKP